MPGQIPGCRAGMGHLPGAPQGSRAGRSPAAEPREWDEPEPFQPSHVPGAAALVSLPHRGSCEQMAALHSHCASVSGASNFYDYFLALLPTQPVKLCYDTSVVAFCGSIILVKDGYILFFCPDLFSIVWQLCSSDKEVSACSRH